LILALDLDFDFGHQLEGRHGSSGGLARELPKELAGNPPGDQGPPPLRS
jgi:hypothetical protein